MPTSYLVTGISEFHHEHIQFIARETSVSSIDCRGLPLCQVSSYCDQGFSFYRANIHTRFYGGVSLYEEALYQAYAPVPLPLVPPCTLLSGLSSFSV